jgi:hypothetical protein
MSYKYFSGDYEKVIICLISTFCLTVLDSIYIFYQEIFERFDLVVGRYAKKDLRCSV